MDKTYTLWIYSPLQKIAPLVFTRFVEMVYNTVVGGIATYPAIGVRLRAVEAVHRGIPRGHVAVTYGID
jgi:hypothetical protein